MAPEFSPDGAGYHLSLAARYLREHGFHRITWNMYANLSAGMEMLFLFAFAFGKHWRGTGAPGFPARANEPDVRLRQARGVSGAGACAGLLVFASPVVGIDGTSAYNDVAVAAIAFTVFYLLQIWDEQRSTRLLIAIDLPPASPMPRIYGRHRRHLRDRFCEHGRAAAIASYADRDRWLDARRY